MASSRSAVYTASSIAAIGGILFGFELGVMSVLMRLPSFNAYFRAITPSVMELIITTLMLGGILGSLVSGFVSEFLGRRRTITLACAFFALGAILQCFATKLEMIYAGRFIAGIGVGHLAMVVPMYLSEISPRHIRGRAVSFQQISFTIGSTLSFVFGFILRNLSGNNPWRVPLGLPAIPAVILGIGCLFLPESPRWLMLKNEEGLAREALIKLRHNDVTTVEQELDVLKEVDHNTLSIGGAYSELFSAKLRGRLLRGVVLQIFQQLSGVTGVFYYTASYLQFAGRLDPIKANLIAQVVYSLIQILGTVPATLYVDRWGRRPMLLIGGIVMTISMLLVGILIGYFPVGHPDTTKSAGYSIAFFIFLFTAAYSSTWGPVSWIYPSEIFPTNVRSKALALTTTINLVFNYLAALYVPTILGKLQYKLYVVFAVIGLVMTVTTFFFFPETKGRSLEEMDRAFSKSKSSHFTQDLVNEKA